MFSEEQNQRNFYSLSQLKDTGWNTSLIEALLIKEDLTKTNPYYRNASPMKLFDGERVSLFKNLPEFEWRTQNIRKNNSEALTLKDPFDCDRSESYQHNFLTELGKITVFLPALSWETIVEQAKASIFEGRGVHFGDNDYAQNDDLILLLSCAQEIARFSTISVHNDRQYSSEHLDHNKARHDALSFSLWKAIQFFHPDLQNIPPIVFQLIKTSVFPYAMIPHNKMCYIPLAGELKIDGYDPVKTFLNQIEEQIPFLCSRFIWGGAPITHFPDLLNSPFLRHIHIPSVDPKYVYDLEAIKIYEHEHINTGHQKKIELQKIIRNLFSIDSEKIKKARFFVSHHISKKDSDYILNLQDWHKHKYLYFSDAIDIFVRPSMKKDVALMEKIIRDFSQHQCALKKEQGENKIKKMLSTYNHHELGISCGLFGENIPVNILEYIFTHSDKKISEDVSASLILRYIMKLKFDLADVVVRNSHALSYFKHLILYRYLPIVEYAVDYCPKDLRREHLDRLLNWIHKSAPLPDEFHSQILSIAAKTHEDRLLSYIDYQHIMPQAFKHMMYLSLQSIFPEEQKKSIYQWFIDRDPKISLRFWNKAFRDQSLSYSNDQQRQIYLKNKRLSLDLMGICFGPEHAVKSIKYCIKEELCSSDYPLMEREYLLKSIRQSGKPKKLPTLSEQSSDQSSAENKKRRKM